MMMKTSSTPLATLLFSLLLFVGVALAKPPPLPFNFVNLEEEKSFAKVQHDDAIAAAYASRQRGRRELFWTIDFVPEADPDFVCDAFQTSANGTYECACDVQPDKSVGLNCLEIETTCNAGDTICFQQNVKLALTTDNVIKSIETCTQYVDLNFTSVEGSSTQFANYSQIMPCVKVIPETYGDFTSLESCTASINGQECHTCEICTDKHAPLLGITMDCCNTNPDGEQLKVDCGVMGGGGSFAPFFETYEEGEMETCSRAATAAAALLNLVLLFVTAATSVVASLF